MIHPATKIPCHLVSGMLGVGKTSAILHYLQTHAERENVAVLVNDIGTIGLDGALLESDAAPTAIKTLQGGCVCCTLLPTMVKTIKALLDSGDITRLIIEPSGIANPAQIMDLLLEHHEELGLELRPIIALLDAEKFRPGLPEMLPFYRHLVESGDVLVFNRADKATPKSLDANLTWARELEPGKLRVLATEHGVLPDELFELALIEPEAGPERGAVCGDSQAHEHADHDHSHHHGEHGHDHDHSHEHDHDHDHDHAPPHDHDPNLHPGGLLRPAALTWDYTALMANLQHLCSAGLDGHRIARLKGIFHTTQGWHAIHLANDDLTHRPTMFRRDNRIDWVIEGASIGEEAMLQALQADAPAGV